MEGNETASDGHPSLEEGGRELGVGETLATPSSARPMHHDPNGGIALVAERDENVPSGLLSSPESTRSANTHVSPEATGRIESRGSGDRRRSELSVAGVFVAQESVTVPASERWNVHGASLTLDGRYHQFWMRQKAAKNVVCMICSVLRSLQDTWFQNGGSRILELSVALTEYLFEETSVTGDVSAVSVGLASDIVGLDAIAMSEEGGSDSDVTSAFDCAVICCRMIAAVVETDAVLDDDVIGAIAGRVRRELLMSTVLLLSFSLKELSVYTSSGDSENFRQKKRELEEGLDIVLGACTACMNHGVASTPDEEIPMGNAAVLLRQAMRDADGCFHVPSYDAWLGTVDYYCQLVDSSQSKLCDTFNRQLGCAKPVVSALLVMTVGRLACVFAMQANYLLTGIKRDIALCDGKDVQSALWGVLATYRAGMCSQRRTAELPLYVDMYCHAVSTAAIVSAYMLTCAEASTCGDMISALTDELVELVSVSLVDVNESSRRRLYNAALRCFARTVWSIDLLLRYCGAFGTEVEIFAPEITKLSSVVVQGLGSFLSCSNLLSDYIGRTIDYVHGHEGGVNQLEWRWERLNSDSRVESQECNLLSIVSCASVEIAVLCVQRGLEQEHVLTLAHLPVLVLETPVVSNNHAVACVSSVVWMTGMCVLHDDAIRLLCTDVVQACVRTVHDVPCWSSRVLLAFGSLVRCYLVGTREDQMWASVSMFFANAVDERREDEVLGTLLSWVQNVKTRPGVAMLGAQVIALLFKEAGMQGCNAAQGRGHDALLARLIDGLIQSLPYVYSVVQEGLCRPDGRVGSVISDAAMSFGTVKEAVELSALYPTLSSDTDQCHDAAGREHPRALWLSVTSHGLDEDGPSSFVSQLKAFWSQVRPLVSGFELGHVNHLCPSRARELDGAGVNGTVQNLWESIDMGLLRSLIWSEAVEMIGATWIECASHLQMRVNAIDRKSALAPRDWPEWVGVLEEWFRVARKHARCWPVALKVAESASQCTIVLALVDLLPTIEPIQLEMSLHRGGATSCVENLCMAFCSDCMGTTPVCIYFGLLVRKAGAVLTWKQSLSLLVWSVTRLHELLALCAPLHVRLVAHEDAHCGEVDRRTSLRSACVSHVLTVTSFLLWLIKTVHEVTYMSFDELGLDLRSVRLALVDSAPLFEERSSEMAQLLCMFALTGREVERLGCLEPRVLRGKGEFDIFYQFGMTAHDAIIANALCMQHSLVAGLADTASSDSEHSSSNASGGAGHVCGGTCDDERRVGRVVAEGTIVRGVCCRRPQFVELALSFSSGCPGFGLLTANCPDASWLSSGDIESAAASVAYVVTWIRWWIECCVAVRSDLARSALQDMLLESFACVMSMEASPLGRLVLRILGRLCAVRTSDRNMMTLLSLAKPRPMAIQMLIDQRGSRFPQQVLRAVASRGNIDVLDAVTMFGEADMVSDPMFSFDFGLTTVGEIYGSYADVPEVFLSWEASTCISTWFKCIDFPVAHAGEWEWDICRFILKRVSVDLLGRKKTREVAVKVVLQSEACIQVCIGSCTMDFEILGMKEDCWHHLFVCIDDGRRQGTCSVFVDTVFFGSRKMKQKLKSQTCRCILGPASPLGAIEWARFPGCRMNVGCTAVFGDTLAALDILALYAGGPGLDFREVGQVHACLSELHERAVSRLETDGSGRIVSLASECLSSGSSSVSSGAWKKKEVHADVEAWKVYQDLDKGLFTEEGDMSPGFHRIPVQTETREIEGLASVKMSGDYVILLLDEVERHWRFIVYPRACCGEVKCKKETSNVLLSEVDLSIGEAMLLDCAKTDTIACVGAELMMHCGGDDPDEDGLLLADTDNLDGRTDADSSASFDTTGSRLSQSASKASWFSSRGGSEIEKTDVTSMAADVADGADTEWVEQRASRVAVRFVGSARLVEMRSGFTALASVGGMRSLLPLMDVMLRSSVEPDWFGVDDVVTVSDEGELVSMRRAPMPSWFAAWLSESTTSRWVRVTAAFVRLLHAVYSTSSSLRLQFDIVAGWPLFAWYWRGVAPSLRVYDSTASAIVGKGQSASTEVSESSLLGLVKAVLGLVTSERNFDGVFPFSPHAVLAHSILNHGMQACFGPTFTALLHDEVCRQCLRAETSSAQWVCMLNREAFFLDGAIFEYLLKQGLSLFVAPDGQRSRLRIGSLCAANVRSLLSLLHHLFHSFEWGVGSGIGAMNMTSEFIAAANGGDREGDGAVALSLDCAPDDSVGRRLARLLEVATACCACIDEETVAPYSSFVERDWGERGDIFGIGIEEICLAAICDSIQFDSRDSAWLNRVRPLIVVLMLNVGWSSMHFTTVLVRLLCLMQAGGYEVVPAILARRFVWWSDAYPYSCGYTEDAATWMMSLVFGVPYSSTPCQSWLVNANTTGREALAARVAPLEKLFHDCEGYVKAFPCHEFDNSLLHVLRDGLGTRLFSLVVGSGHSDSCDQVDVSAVPVSNSRGDLRFMTDLLCLLGTSRNMATLVLRMKLQRVLCLLWGPSIVKVSCFGMVTGKQLVFSQLGGEDLGHYWRASSKWKSSFFASNSLTCFVLPLCLDVQRHTGKMTTLPRDTSYGEYNSTDHGQLERSLYNRFRLFVCDVAVDHVLSTGSFEQVEALLNGIMSNGKTGMCVGEERANSLCAFLVVTILRVLLAVILARSCTDGKRKWWQDRLGVTLPESCCNRVYVSDQWNRHGEAIADGAARTAIAYLCDVLGVSAQMIRDGGSTIMVRIVRNYLWDVFYTTFVMALARCCIWNKRHSGVEPLINCVIVLLRYASEDVQKKFALMFGPAIWFFVPWIDHYLGVEFFASFVDDDCALVAFGARCGLQVCCARAVRAVWWGRSSRKVFRLETLFFPAAGTKKVVRVNFNGAEPFGCAWTSLLSHEVEWLRESMVGGPSVLADAALDPSVIFVDKDLDITRKRVASSLCCVMIHVALARMWCTCVGGLHVDMDMGHGGGMDTLAAAMADCQPLVLYNDVGKGGDMGDGGAADEDVVSLHISDVVLDDMFAEIVVEYLTETTSIGAAVGFGLQFLGSIVCKSTNTGTALNSYFPAIDTIVRPYLHKSVSLIDVARGLYRDTEGWCLREQLQDGMEPWSALCRMSRGVRCLLSAECAKLTCAAILQSVVASMNKGVVDVRSGQKGARFVVLVPVLEGALLGDASERYGVIRAVEEFGETIACAARRKGIHPYVAGLCRPQRSYVGRSIVSVEAVPHEPLVHTLKRDFFGGAVADEHDLRNVAHDAAGFAIFHILCAGFGISEMNRVGMAIEANMSESASCAPVLVSQGHGAVPSSAGTVVSAEAGAWADCRSYVASKIAGNEVQNFVSIPERFMGLPCQLGQADTVARFLSDFSVRNVDVAGSTYAVCRLLGPFVTTIPGLFVHGRESVYFFGGAESVHGGRLVDRVGVADVGAICADEAASQMPWLHVPWKQVLRISRKSIVASLPRLYLFQDVAVELVMTDGSHWRFSFADSGTRDSAIKLLSRENHSICKGDIDRTVRWKLGQVSNYDYIMSCNQCVGRSVFDVLQYPIFPIVLGNVYDSQEIDLRNSSTFRVLGAPCGNQKGTAWAPDADLPFVYSGDFKFSPGESPYGCAYVSMYTGIVRYLCRLPPFTHALITNQQALEAPERSFVSLSSLYSSQRSQAHVHEAIPEFFSEEDAFVNRHGLRLGMSYNSGHGSHDVDDVRIVDDVVLPPWAESPRIAVKIFRAALESVHVSLRLHKWLNLILGPLQRGENSERCGNVYARFHYADEMASETHHARLSAAMMGIAPPQMFQRPAVAKQVASYLLRMPSLLTCPSLLTAGSFVRCIVARIPAFLRTTSSSIWSVFGTAEPVLYLPCVSDVSCWQRTPAATSMSEGEERNGACPSFWSTKSALQRAVEHRFKDEVVHLSLLIFAGMSAAVDRHDTSFDGLETSSMTGGLRDAATTLLSSIGSASSAIEEMDVVDIVVDKRTAMSDATSGQCVRVRINCAEDVCDVLDDDDIVRLRGQVDVLIRDHPALSPFFEPSNPFDSGPFALVVSMKRCVALRRRLATFIALQLLVAASNEVGHVTRDWADGGSSHAELSTASARSEASDGRLLGFVRTGGRLCDPLQTSCHGIPVRDCVYDVLMLTRIGGRSLVSSALPDRRVRALRSICDWAHQCDVVAAATEVGAARGGVSTLGCVKCEVLAIQSCDWGNVGWFRHPCGKWYREFVPSSRSSAFLAGVSAANLDGSSRIGDADRVHGLHGLVCDEHQRSDGRKPFHGYRDPVTVVHAACSHVGLPVGSQNGEIGGKRCNLLENDAVSDVQYPDVLGRFVDRLDRTEHVMCRIDAISPRYARIHPLTAASTAYPRAVSCVTGCSSGRGYVALRRGVQSAAREETVVVWLSSRSGAHVVPMEPRDEYAAGHWRGPDVRGPLLADARCRGQVRIKIPILSEVSSRLRICSLAAKEVHDYKSALEMGELCEAQLPGVDMCIAIPPVLSFRETIPKSFGDDARQGAGATVADKSGYAPFGYPDGWVRHPKLDRSQVYSRLLLLVSLAVLFNKWVHQVTKAAFPRMLGHVTRFDSDGRKRETWMQPCGMFPVTDRMVNQLQRRSGSTYHMGFAEPLRKSPQGDINAGSGAKVDNSNKATAHGAFDVSCVTDAAAHGDAITCATGIEAGLIVYGSVSGHLRVVGCETSTEGRVRCIGVHSIGNVSELFRMRVHYCPVVSLGCSVIRKLLVSGDAEGMAFLWNVRSLSLVCELSATIISMPDNSAVVSQPSPCTQPMTASGQGDGTATSSSLTFVAPLLEGDRYIASRFMWVPETVISCCVCDASGDIAVVRKVRPVRRTSHAKAKYSKGVEASVPMERKHVRVSSSLWTDEHVPHVPTTRSTMAFERSQLGGQWRSPAFARGRRPIDVCAAIGEPQERDKVRSWHGIISALERVGEPVTTDDDDESGDAAPSAAEYALPSGEWSVLTIYNDHGVPVCHRIVRGVVGGMCYASGIEGVCRNRLCVGTSTGMLCLLDDWYYNTGCSWQTQHGPISCVYVFKDRTGRGQPIRGLASAPASSDDVNIDDCAAPSENMADVSGVTRTVIVTGDIDGVVREWRMPSGWLREDQGLLYDIIKDTMLGKPSAPRT